MLAQDFATHGMYTEPNTGMTFYASYQTNDGAPGGMLDGRSWGGFTDGIALPPSAATTDATEYIGLIVSIIPHHERRITNLYRSVQLQLAPVMAGQVFSKGLKMQMVSCGPEWFVILWSLLGPLEMEIRFTLVSK